MSFDFLKKPVVGPTISFENLSLSLGGTQILDDVSFNIESGSIHTIIGPNGGGKTSLLKSLLGEMPHTGTIIINWQGKKQIGYMPQFINIHDNVPITVNDFMAVSVQKYPAFLGISKSCRTVINDALNSVGIINKGDIRVSKLSGGERQRLLLAQALIPMP
jgi:zinc transport system ATP-binding protein